LGPAPQSVALPKIVAGKLVGRDSVEPSAPTEREMSPCTMCNPTQTPDQRDEIKLPDDCLQHSHGSRRCRLRNDIAVTDSRQSYEVEVSHLRDARDVVMRCDRD